MLASPPPRKEKPAGAAGSITCCNFPAGSLGCGRQNFGGHSGHHRKVQFDVVLVSAPKLGREWRTANRPRKLGPGVRPQGEASRASVSLRRGSA